MAAGLELDRHNAGSDSRACAELMLEYMLGDRPRVESILCKKGVIPVSGVTRKTDCLFVGSKGSEAWSNGNYDTKVKKAMELQGKGIFIQIVKEQDICDLLSD